LAKSLWQREVVMRPIIHKTRIILGFTLAVAATPSNAAWVDAIAASNPINWYQFEEQDGNQVHDSGSDPYLGTFMSLPAVHKPGLVGQALDFDDSNRAIRMDGRNIVGDWTAEFVLLRKLPVSYRHPATSAVLLWSSGLPPPGSPRGTPGEPQ
jgi:hypothetical protein